MTDRDNAQVEGADEPKRKPGRPPETIVVRVKQNVMDPNHADDYSLQLHERKLWAGTKEEPRYAEVPRKWAQTHLEAEHIAQCSDREVQAFKAGKLKSARVRGGNAPTVGRPEDTERVTYDPTAA